ncbi:antitermination protein N [Citrobacter sp. Cf084]|uniref:antitermination protein N n=1 Tax=Citrobacter sp. Cf084 TaxID=2985053 RepID=UPI002574A5D8|nr:antitermination protein N [Citrobacter sp. Cf084]EKT9265741.1 antitermination protein [Citrobacter freundii]EKU4730598.1 antitermination protein [Citrobacter freundii]EKV2293863.1 antitermination protein [Citrobacter freundii]EKW0770578.1 antitermination protein [Citrobacter freundii]MDM3217015.1 antitermination protein N [Citrobacter sp. Cf084]
MDAQARRRERRAKKQAEWKAANPLLVGVSAKPDNRPVLSLTRKPKSRVESAVNPIDLTVLAEYREEMERRAEAVERKNQRTWYKDVNPFGNKIHAVQKSRGKSTPLI